MDSCLFGQVFLGSILRKSFPASGNGAPRHRGLYHDRYPDRSRPDHHGVSLLAAHMIIFWLSQDSNVTPPVCLAAFAASSIAGSPPMATGFTSWKLAKGLYIMPLLFAYTGLINGSWSERVLISAFALVGLFAFAAAFAGYMFGAINVFVRTLLILCAVAILWPGTLCLNVLGVLVLCGIGIYNKRAL